MRFDHLDIESMVSLQFGELADNRARRMKQHLAGCSACRPVFERLQGSMEDGEPLPTKPVDSSRLLTRIRAWDTNGDRSGHHGAALKGRIAVELAPYVGRAGADTLLRPVQDDGRDLLSTVAPFLAMFLGRRAAGIIITRVVEKTIVGSRTLCES